MARSDREQKDRQGSRRRQPMERPGKRRPCYFCKEKIDEVDWKNLNERLRQNSVQEKLSDLWLEHLIGQRRELIRV